VGMSDGWMSTRSARESIEPLTITINTMEMTMIGEAYWSCKLGAETSDVPYTIRRKAYVGTECHMAEWSTK
jgi:hypothetical protein